LSLAARHSGPAGMTTAAAAELELISVCKSFGSVVAVDRCDLKINRGEIVALLGASGCGKSTLLNMIAGFEQPDYGTISVRGSVINDIPPHRRNVAMVFQHYAMFPHLTVAENIAYGLQARRVDKREARVRVGEMMELLKLTGLESRYPAQLSGGQRQRVAVARALAVRPDTLLLDEAFSALDRNLREGMQLELSLLLRRLSVTTVLVTHDQREAFVLADRIAVMESGRLAQIGTAEEVYRNPTTTYVLRFLGTINQLRVAVVPSGAGLEARLGSGVAFALPPQLAAASPGSEISLDLRAEHVAISPQATAVHHSAPATVSLRTFLGAQERIVLQLDGQQVLVDRPASVGGERLAIGDRVYIDFDPARCALAADR
jgi:ABC-type Fe3+/spermidine/putrescine transport system ATPase subunit